MKKRDLNKYVFIVFLLVLFLLAFLIAKPFITDLLSAMILAYVFYPLYKKLQKRIGYKFLSSLFIVILIVLLITLPLTWIANSFYSEIKDFFLVNNEIQEFIGSQESEYSNIMTIKELGEVLMEKGNLLSKAYEFFNLISTVSSTVIHFFITMFMTFFFLRDGDKFSNFLKETFRFKTGYGLDVPETLQKTIHAVIYGIVIVAFMQAVIALLAYIGLSFFGAIKNPLFWSILTFFAAFIPTVGTGLVWLPMSLYLIIKGVLVDQMLLVILGGALIAYGSIFIGTIDNFIRPKLIGDRANIHPVVVLIGVLGGVGFFGIMGIVIGPVIFALAQEILILYKNNRL